MAAGLTANLTAQQYQTIQGNICQAFMTLAAQVAELKAFNDAQGGAGLQALPAASGGTQITSGDASTMISAISNLSSVFTVAQGTGTIGTASDYTTFVKQCIGTGVR